MARTIKRGCRLNQTGAVVPLVAIMLILFIGCLALVVDLGLMHNVKVQLQRAADSAALAGALQLDTGADHGTRATNAARSAAAGNRVNGMTGYANADGWVSDTSVLVQMGTWDPDPTNSGERFSSVALNSMLANAVEVVAQVEVQNIFGRIFRNSTWVRAEAIAVTSYAEPGLPIAMLSCIPLTAHASDFSSSVCDVNFYKFTAVPEDNAGWTTLTYSSNVNAANLKYLLSPEGNIVLNKILYGTGEAHDGLENENVIPACGDRNIGLGTSIECGLGVDFDPSVAPADDPLNYNPLPRWTDRVAFKRILTMDGLLVPIGTETETQYKTRLRMLRRASDPNDTYSIEDYRITYEPAYLAAFDDKLALPTYLGDARFLNYIQEHPSGALNRLEVKLDLPLYDAGYPSVAATEGAVTAALDEFIDLIKAADGQHFRGDLTTIKYPLNETADPDTFNDPRSHGGGETLPITIPVIFAGVCGDDGTWRALGEHQYIGTANLLLTRVWKNKNDCYSAINPVQVFDDPLCVDPFVPSLLNDTFGCVTGGDAEAGIEGLIVPKGEEDDGTGILRVFLVR